MEITEKQGSKESQFRWKTRVEVTQRKVRIIFARVVRLYGRQENEL